MTENTDFSSKSDAGSKTMNKTCWMLKRYGRLARNAAESEGRSSWKVFENSESAGQLVFNIVESGHLLVSQGPELLEGFSLLNASSFLKVLRKTDVLLFRMTAKGEGRVFQVQFAGSSREEALELCSSAVACLKQHVPVEDAPVPNGSAQTGPRADPEPRPSLQQPGACAEQPAGTLKPEESESSLSVQRLAQCFLGQAGVSLPMAYRQQALPSVSLGPLLRLCLLDCSFPAWVEQVEAELTGLAHR
ncbi:meiotic recombination protein REC114 [Paramormyrops kingsleyae]|uniref:REC114 meiotic recombination protein n=1 Tax=Paramormyrops kingsleyae TaxID=1676925 RepID=A0A3B3Q699_9TELE|nr:meiotic recombination protein REC114 [Paramormyrops kingsleyae]XP_023675401.1 meiotic recombination protein REC114 [Paramormyrops kingsleyae]